MGDLFFLLAALTPVMFLLALAGWIGDKLDEWQERREMKQNEACADRDRSGFDSLCRTDFDSCNNDPMGPKKAG